MSGVNKVILIGRLGADPEIRFLPDGKGVANFRIATSKSWTTKEGKKEEKVEWHNIVAFGKLAEIVGAYLKKGRLIFIEGKLQTRQWEDKNKNKRYTTEIIAQTIQMLAEKEKVEEVERSEASETSGEDEKIPF